MPLYCFKCNCGETIEVVKPMSESHRLQLCACGEIMSRVYSFNCGNKEYAKPLHSDSLAITPGQVAEHQRLFPDVKIDSDCRPVFENYQQHNKYLEKTGFIKQPKKIKNCGKKIA